MNEFLERAKRIGSAVMSAVTRAVDPPLDASARPIDIRRAILEAVERRTEPAGDGRRVLPASAARVRLLVEDPGARTALDAVLGDLQDAVAIRLREIRCEMPRGFAIDITYLRRAPAGWPADQRLAVEFAAPTTGIAPPAVQPALTLTVLKGDADRSEFIFTEPVVRIGRSAEPTDDLGRPRFNHVAFLENDSAENRTVTRGHAHIRYLPGTNEYRLFDEGSANGTRVLRRGMAIDVPRRDPVGLALVTGDEVQFGKAAVRVQIADR